MVFDASKGLADPSDVTLALLFKIGPDGELIYVDHQAVAFDGVDENGAPRAVSGSVSWSVEPGERYVTSLVVAGNGQGSGTVLVIDGMEYVYLNEPVWAEPEYEDGSLVAVAIAGNALSDSPENGDTASGGPLPGAAASHAEAFGSSVTRFFLNGEWHAADGETLRWEGDDGARYAFRLDGDGKYSLEVEGMDPAPVAGSRLHIVYETESESGTPTQAILSIEAPGHVPDTAVAGKTGEDGGVVHGVPHGVTDEAFLSGAADTDPADSGTEAYAVTSHGGTPAGGMLTVPVFSLSGNDRLSFESLLEETEDLGLLLESGRITLSGEGDALRLEICTQSGEELHVDVAFDKEELASFSAGYMEKYGSAEGLEQALLQMALGS